MKKVFWLAPAAALLLFMAKRGGFLEPTNICQTQPDHEEIALRTRHYSAPPDAVRSAVVQTVGAQKTYFRAWRVVATQPEIHAEVPVFFFIDDLKISLQKENDGTRLDVRSASRVGRGDFGENRRHVLQLLRQLDKRLTALRPA